MDLEKGVVSVNEKVSQEIIDFILEPYFPGCRYLKEATMDLNSKPRLDGEFHIPYCYYGNGPGHFNATEFVLSFNQMAYVFFANGVEKGIMRELNMSSKEDFKKVQMNGAYIARSNMEFKKPIDSKEFSGSLILDNFKSINNRTFYSMNVNFEDKNHSKAKGSFLISIDHKNG